MSYRKDCILLRALLQGLGLIPSDLSSGHMPDNCGHSMKFLILDLIFVTQSTVHLKEEMTLSVP